MIPFVGSKYTVPRGRGEFCDVLFGGRPVKISDEWLCDECRRERRFRVYIFLIDEPRKNESPFYGGLIFFECERCGTLFVTRLPKPSDRK